MITHGTDIGPACKRCEGTVYGYECCAPFTWRLWCAGCHAYDYIHVPSGATDVESVRKAHCKA